ncbi:MAG: LCP family protein [Candidatus Shapirobacteria bacterium]|nr:LCP family protein [Candidatus Shapirobacteria bacterium]
MIKKILIGVSLFNISLIIFAGIYGYINYKKIVVKPNQPIVSIQPTPTLDPLRPYSILLLGYGGGTHDGTYLTDSIIVARVEPKNKKITLISVPRDLWVPIPITATEDKNFKVNAAYSIGNDNKRYPQKKVEFTGAAGGGELAKYVVGRIVGFNIDYFAALDFQGFTKTVDILGGINVPIQTTFDDYLYPIGDKEKDTCGKSDEEIKALTATISASKLEESFTCRYEHLHFDAGSQTMDGQTALKFVRSRHSLQDDGDFGRSLRQKLVITSIKNKIINSNFIPKIIPFINTISANLKTDMDFNKMHEFINNASELSQYKIESIALTDKNVLEQGKSADGQYVLLPKAGDNNWTEVQNFINNPASSPNYSQFPN